MGRVEPDCGLEIFKRPLESLLIPEDDSSDDEEGGMLGLASDRLFDQCQCFLGRSSGRPHLAIVHEQIDILIFFGIILAERLEKDG